MKKRYDRLPHISFWRSTLAEALQYPVPTGPSALSLSIPKAARDWAAEVLGESRSIAISLSALTPLKRYLEWTSVIERLRASCPGYHLLLIGMQSPDPELAKAPGILDWTRRTSLTELAALIDAAAVVVGTDGLVTNLAAVLSRPTVALFSIIRPDYVIDSELLRAGQVKALTTGSCPKQFCYPMLGNYRHAACPADPNLPDGCSPICMKFPVDEVVEAIHSQLETKVEKGPES